MANTPVSARRITSSCVKLSSRAIAVSADTSLLKWGTKAGQKKLLDRMGVDYGKAPAEDFATGIITFENPETTWPAFARLPMRASMSERVCV